ncbi:MAG: glycoside hydrolase family 95-like protein [Lachnospiraceae bacterium]
MPALPSAWKDGYIKGLCVKGGAEVDIYWANNKLTNTVIRAKKDICTKLRYEENIQEITLGAGEEREVRF